MWISVPIAITEPGAALHPRLDALGRTDLVGHLDDVVRALRVHDDLDARMLGACGLDVCGPEPLVDGAVTLPQQERRFLDLALLEPAELVARIPDAHVALGVAHRVAGVAAEVLVGEEEHLVAACERPLEDCTARSTTCTRHRRCSRRTPSAPPTSSCT